MACLLHPFGQYLSTILWNAGTRVPFNSTCLIQSSAWSECPIRHPTLPLLPCWKFNFQIWPIQPHWHCQFNLPIQPFNWLVVFNPQSSHPTDPLPKCGPNPERQALTFPSVPQSISSRRVRARLNWMVHGYRHSRVWYLLLDRVDGVGWWVVLDAVRPSTKDIASTSTSLFFRRLAYLLH
jgi:hypothetical protein